MLVFTKRPNVDKVTDQNNQTYVYRRNNNCLKWIMKNASIDPISYYKLILWKIPTRNKWTQLPKERYNWNK